MREILSDRYQLAFAHNGIKALEISQKMETDLILLDIMMPEMDGYEVCRALKKNLKTKDIPIIFITAKDEVDDEAKGLELGAIDYIAKPISPSIFKARVKNHLELKYACERIEKQKKRLEDQNRELIKAARLREDIERISRHDMKNPLNAVIGMSQVLQDNSNLTEEQSEQLKMIEDAGYVLLNMINLSLNMFKMEKGTYPFEPEKINIINVTRQILNEMKPMMASKGLSAAVFVNGVSAGDNSHCWVQGEKLLCYSMLINLIKNAVEASPKDSQITIHFDNTGNRASIRIHNKGAVPEDIRGRFFDKYVTSGKKCGTGLGTYSAKLIAETQGGSVHLDTSDEQGTLLIIQMNS
jgi:signal transduction histidine kinase